MIKENVKSEIRVGTGTENHKGSLFATSFLFWLHRSECKYINPAHLQFRPSVYRDGQSEESWLKGRVN